MTYKFKIPNKYNVNSVGSEKVVYDMFCDIVAQLNSPIGYEQQTVVLPFDKDTETGELLFEIYEEK